MLLRYYRPRSYSARASRRLGFLALVITCVAFVTHRIGLIETPVAVAVGFAATVLATCAVVLALIGLWRLWQVGAEAGIAASKGLIFSLVPLALFAGGVVLYRNSPPVYDVSTDIYAVPDWLSEPHADQMWMSRPADKAGDQRALQFFAFPGLSTRRYDGGLDRIYQAVTKIAKSEHVTIVQTRGTEQAETDLENLPTRKKKAKPKVAPLRRPPTTAQADDAGDDEASGEQDMQAGTEPLVPPDPEVPDIGPLPAPRPAAQAADGLPALGRKGEVLLQGTKKTLVLGLTFDVMIRLQEETETTLVDIRVASRYGAHDLGFSAGVANSFLKSLDAELLGISAN